MITPDDIISLIANYNFLNKEDINPSQLINVYGFDSSVIYDLSLIIEEKYDVEINLNDFDFCETSIRELSIQKFSEMLSSYINGAAK